MVPGMYTSSMYSHGRSSLTMSPKRACCVARISSAVPRSSIHVKFSWAMVNGESRPASARAAVISSRSAAIRSGGHVGRAIQPSAAAMRRSTLAFIAGRSGDASWASWLPPAAQTGGSGSRRGSTVTPSRS